MLIRRADDIRSSAITPESVYLRRRDFIGGLAGGAIAGLMGGVALAGAGRVRAEGPEGASGLAQLQYRRATDGPASFRTDEKLTPFEHVASYNNFYEFGPDKDDPSRHAAALTTQPWQVAIEGEVEKPGVQALEDVLAGVALQERIYRLRCVEAWSMVIPWVGFPLATLLKRVGMTSRAKYVAFRTLHRPAEMPGQRSRSGLIDWPYVEGLRIDEAMHPLTLLAVGLYGRVMPNQNGAPLRLVVPWKYGFKSIKSIVAIRLQDRQPPTSWNRLAPHEYGFYANVNPAVDHPRWSQAHERRLPGSLLRPGRIETLPFNGYGEQVASLYAGMDLRRFY